MPDGLNGRKWRRLRFVHPDSEDLLRPPPAAAAPRKPRQPVHTVFGGAQLFRAGVVERFRELAIESLDTYAGDDARFQSAFEIGSPELAARVRAMVLAKLRREPVEDYRIDFEDGYGVRADAEEDGHAVSAANEVADAMQSGVLPWRIGIRVKSLDTAERARALRTLRLFVSTLLERAGALPPNFIVNLPKIRAVAAVAEFAVILSDLERELGLAANSLPFEVMIETPQIVMGADGRTPLPLIAGAGGGRIVAAVFGAYDFTSPLGITAAHQSLRHPVCDFARNMMLVSMAGSGIQLSDGATAALPVDDERTVHAAWRVHYGNIQHAMKCGFYQGWDLHPAQLVSRYAATYAFFLDGREAAAARLKNFIAKAAQATRVGGAFDDAATGNGLLNFFRLAVNCGAMTMDEVAAMAGVDAAMQESGF